MYIGICKGYLFDIGVYKEYPEIYNARKSEIEQLIEDGYFELYREDVYVATQKLEDEQRQQEWLYIKNE